MSQFPSKQHWLSRCCKFPTNGESVAGSYKLTEKIKSKDGLIFVVCLLVTDFGGDLGPTESQTMMSESHSCFEAFEAAFET